MKPNKGNNNKKNAIGLISLILWAMVLTMLFRSCTNSYANANQVQVDYSTFRTWVAEDLVDAVRMESSQYIIILKEGAEEKARSYLPEESFTQGGSVLGVIPVQNHQEVEYVTTIPPVTDLEIYTLMDDHGVDYGSDPVDSSTYILSLLMFSRSFLHDKTASEVPSSRENP